ncbi:MAG: hydrogenase maturation protease [Bacteroidales bacterium]|nr:hydrogenase maturation protease [Bacteroidales bacterium]
MPELEELLERANRLLFIGVGNVLKRDDGVGVVISNQIIERPDIKSLTVEVSIENYIGKINSLEPGEIVIVDCMELGSNPGTYRLMTLENVEDITFNTHNISLGRVGDFFQYPSYVLGIQPKSVEFGDHLSPPVQDSADRIVRLINQQNK